MTTEPTVDEPTTVLAPIHEHHDLATDKVHTTPAQAKNDAVSSLLAKAVERASDLRLTPDETKALKAEFADECFRTGARGKEQLIYLEHVFLRERLDAVLGMGQWALVPRSRWTEKQRQSVTVYLEAMLIVRGCYITEAIGSMDYYPNNASSDFSDAVEGAESAALRRCAKKMGIGLQAWSKTWCEGWWKRRIQAAKKTPATSAAAPNMVQLREGTLPLLLREAAKGTKSLETAWLNITIQQRQACAIELARLKGIAAANDTPVPREPGDEPPDPFEIPANALNGVV